MYFNRLCCCCGVVVQFSSGVSWCGVVLVCFVVWWVLLLWCVCCLFWLVVWLCGCVRDFVVCCCRVWLCVSCVAGVLCVLFLLSVLVLVCVALSAVWWVLFSVRGFAPGGVVVAPLFCCSCVVWLVCCSWCVSLLRCFSCAVLPGYILSPGWFLLLCGSCVVGCFWFFLVVVGWVVLLLRCFWCVTIKLVCGPAPGLTQNATLVGWLCGVSAPGGYASGWLCAIQLVRLSRASRTRSVLFRPSVVRVSCRSFSILPPFAHASRLITPVSGCWFALICANRVSPFGVVRFSCRWQCACSFSLFMLLLGYVLNVARVSLPCLIVAYPFLLLFVLFFVFFR